MRTVSVSRQAEHCGSVYNLKVRSELSEGARQQPSNRVHPAGRHRITLYIGEVAASQSPVVMDTLLGSCVAVCMYDPVLRAGGMNHILLPRCLKGDKSPRCGVHAMELLINEVMKLGGDRRRFIAKAFGGGNVLPGIQMLQIGDENAEFVREFLATERIPLVAERLGGDHAVHLYFQTDTGRASVHSVNGSALPKIIKAESSCFKPPVSNGQFGGEITLF